MSRVLRLKYCRKDLNTPCTNAHLMILTLPTINVKFTVPVAKSCLKKKENLNACIPPDMFIDDIVYGFSY